MNATKTTQSTGFLCKSCGAESPRGIGYAASSTYAYPAPGADCFNPHVRAR